MGRERHLFQCYGSAASSLMVKEEKREGANIFSNYEKASSMFLVRVMGAGQKG
jgi:hypothetical protein